jgi:hypothetical protein
MLVVCCHFLNIDNHINIFQEGDVFFSSGVCLCPSKVHGNGEGSTDKGEPMANRVQCNTTARNGEYQAKTHMATKKGGLPVHPPWKLAVD